MRAAIVLGIIIYLVHIEAIEYGRLSMPGVAFVYCMAVAGWQDIKELGLWSGRQRRR